MRSALHSALLLLLLCSPRPARAEPPYQPPEFVREPAVLPDGGAGAAPAQTLSLQDAIQTAVTGNLGVALTRERRNVARYGVTQAEGAFEPRISASYAHTRADRPPSSSVMGMPGDVLHVTSDNWALVYQQKLRTGTTLTLQSQNSRSANSAADALEPLLYSTAFELELSQPLLRGFSFDLDMPQADVLRARLGRDQAGLELRQSMMTVVRDTENAYWNLLGALKDYQVRARSLELSVRQLELSQRQIRAGVLPPSDLVNAESTVARRRLELVQARERVERMSDQLRRVLNLPADSWQKPLLPSDVAGYEELSVSETDVFNEAVHNRPDLERQRLAVTAAALDVRVAKNDQLPQIDLGVRYALVGQEDAYGGALDQALGAEAPSWTALVTLTWTPLGRASGARVASEKAQQRQAALELEQHVLDLRGEVRAAVRNVASTADQVRAAAQFRELAERNLDIEERKFLNGMSNNFMIEQRQEAVALAQLAELDALIQRQQAIAELHLVKGTILDYRHITVSP